MFGRGSGQSETPFSSPSPVAPFCDRPSNSSAPTSETVLEFSQAVEGLLSSDSGQLPGNLTHSRCSVMSHASGVGHIYPLRCREGTR